MEKHHYPEYGNGEVMASLSGSEHKTMAELPK
jgi:hypothetical protein